MKKLEVQPENSALSRQAGLEEFVECGRCLSVKAIVQMTALDNLSMRS